MFRTKKLCWVRLALVDNNYTCSASFWTVVKPIQGTHRYKDALDPFIYEINPFKEGVSSRELQPFLISKRFISKKKIIKSKMTEKRGD
jgi:hypothetical protein